MFIRAACLESSASIAPCCLYTFIAFATVSVRLNKLVLSEATL